jgi:importin subunit beta-1
MAAGTALSLLAQTAGDDIVQGVIPFVESNIKDQGPEGWHKREAAVMAFGSILDGPDPKVLAGLVAQALPTLIEMMQDPNVHVKDTAAWTLGRISDILIETIKPDVHLPPLVAALVRGLEDSTRIVGNCCWSLMNLAEQLGVASMEEDPLPSSTPLSPFYEHIVSALMRVTEKYA